MLLQNSASRNTATRRAEQQRTRQQRQYGHERLVGDLHQRDGRPRRRVAARRGHRDGNIRASSSAELQRAGGGGCNRRLRPAHDLHISHATHSTARLPATQVAAISAMPGSESARGSEMLPMRSPLAPPPACKRAAQQQGSGRVLPATAGLELRSAAHAGRLLAGGAVRVSLHADMLVGPAAMAERHVPRTLAGKARLRAAPS